MLLFFGLAVLAASGAHSGPLSALRFLPPYFLSDGELALLLRSVNEARGHVLCSVEYSRHGGQHRSADRPMGSLLIQPLHLRRVPIKEGFRRHFNRASALPFPLDSRLRATALSSDLQCSVRRAVAAGDDLAEVRVAQLRAMSAVADSVRPISVRINSLMPATVRRIAWDVNTAYLAVLIEALDWLDVDLVQRFVEGFPIVGDIPDSGVYRRLDNVADDLLFQSRFSFFNISAPSHNRKVTTRFHYRRWASDTASDVAVAKKSHKEAGKGLIVGPFESVDDVWRAMVHMYPGTPPRELYPRLLPRFGVPQKGEVRAIDDGRSSYTNAATRMHETVTTPSFFYPAVVARAVAVASEAQGLHSAPPMVICLLDLAAAYRTVPTSQPWHTTVCFFDPLVLPPRPQFYWLPGHNFGLASAVVNFNRFPELVVVVARAYYIAPVEHYYDDFIAPDLAAGGDTARRVVETIITDLGSGRARRLREPFTSPSIDPAKTKEPAPAHVTLGVVANLTHVAGARPRVLFSVDLERIAAVLEVFRDAYRKGILTPHLASSLRGKLFFLLSAAYAHVGRAATLPLVQRQYRDTVTFFLEGSELHHSLLFFEALLPRLPPLVVPLVPDATPPLLVYTDASFWTRKRRGDECANPRERLRGGLGAVVYDPVSNLAYVASSAPPWDILLSSWRLDRKTYIAELETIAAISVYSTYPDLFAGRRVNHFIDNTVANSALVHGYAGKPDLAKSVNVFYLQMMALRASVYFEYVPSKANIADLPSRNAWAALRLELAGVPIAGGFPDQMVVPDVASWLSPLSSWATHASGAGARVPL